MLLTANIGCRLYLGNGLRQRGSTLEAVAPVAAGEGNWRRRPAPRRYNPEAQPASVASAMPTRQLSPLGPPARRAAPTATLAGGAAAGAAPHPGAAAPGRRPRPSAAMPPASCASITPARSAPRRCISARAAVARDAAARRHLLQAAEEETDHLAWCHERLDELASRPSLLNPLWYAGAWAIGAAAGLRGDGWNLGFVVETGARWRPTWTTTSATRAAACRGTRCRTRHRGGDEGRRGAPCRQRAGAGASPLPAPVPDADGHRRRAHAQSWPTASRRTPNENPPRSPGGGSDRCRRDRAGPPQSGLHQIAAVEQLFDFAPQLLLDALAVP